MPGHGLDVTSSGGSDRATAAASGRLLRACPAGVWVVDDDGRTLLANDAIVRMLGASPSELVDTPATRFFHPSDLEATRELLRGTGSPADARALRLRRADGHVVRVVASASTWSHGARRGTVLAVSPSTMSMQGVEQLRRRERQFREAERLGNLGSWEWEVATGRLTFSDELYRIFGIEPSIVEPSLESVVERTVPSDRAYFVGVVEEIAAGSRDLPFERRIHRPDGEVRTLHSNSRVIETDEDGHPVRVVGVCHDVTSERRALERGRRFQELYEGERQVAERLRQLDELKFAFMAAVSHDLREPLAAVMGSAATLREIDVHADRETVHGLLDQTIEHAERLDRLLSDLLDLERLRRGTAEGVFRPVAVGELVRATIAGIAVDERIEFSMREPDIVADVDPPKLERVVENVVRIALRNSPSRAPVRVTVDGDDDGLDGFVRLTVVDEGPSLPDEAKPRAFEPFVTGSPRVPQASSGLSRAIVGRYVRLHGGRVWIEDEPGGGSRTTIELPREHASMPARTAATPGEVQA